MNEPISWERRQKGNFLERLHETPDTPHQGLSVKWSLAVPSHLPKATLYLMALTTSHANGLNRSTFHEVGGRWAQSWFFRATFKVSLTCLPVYFPWLLLLISLTSLVWLLWGWDLARARVQEARWATHTRHHCYRGSLRLEPSDSGNTVGRRGQLQSRSRCEGQTGLVTY